MKQGISRRDFLKLAGLGLGTMALNPYDLSSRTPAKQYPDAENLGRVAVYPYFYSTEIKAKPDFMAATVRPIPDDEVVVWQREVIGAPAFGWSNRRWVETNEGYIYAPFVQPVKNLPNTPLTAMPDGKAGFWAEVTVPHVDLRVENAASAWVKDTLADNLIPRLYYSQVVWIDRVQADQNGQILYRFNEDFGHGYGPGDLLWGDGSAFYPLTPEDVAPISPDVDPATKRILIDRTGEYQTLSCYEGNTEVYFCRVSTGVKTDSGEYLTPLGDHKIERKFISFHMSSNSPASGYDTPAVSWTTLFSYSTGVAIHAAFWHNLFGDRRSHGCVNCHPEDAKWIFRWTLPTVSLDQGDVQELGTEVTVTEKTWL